MKCPNCGKEIANDSLFCEFCGTKVTKEKANKKKKWGVVLALCILIIGGLIYYIATSNSREKVDEGYSLSYVVHDDNMGDVDFYFVLVDHNKVLWLCGTPYGNVYPLGYGCYDSHEKTTKLDYAYNYGSSEMEKIVFSLDVEKKSARLVSPNWLRSLQYNGREFPLNTETRNLIPSDELVGGTWRSLDDFELNFKSKIEVIIRYEEKEKTCLYTLIDNTLSIKSGDNLFDETLIGKVVNGNEVHLYREGWTKDRNRDRWNVVMYKQ